MLTHALAVVALAALCGGWVLLQRWIATRAPDLPGIKRGCGGCSAGGACERTCESATDLEDRAAARQG